MEAEQTSFPLIVTTYLEELNFLSLELFTILILAIIQHVSNFGFYTLLRHNIGCLVWVDQYFLFDICSKRWKNPESIQEFSSKDLLKEPPWAEVNIVSVLGRDEGYTVKYNPLPVGVPEGKAQENS